MRTDNSIWHTTANVVAFYENCLWLFGLFQLKYDFIKKCSVFISISCHGIISSFQFFSVQLFHSVLMHISLHWLGAFAVPTCLNKFSTPKIAIANFIKLQYNMGWEMTKRWKIRSTECTLPELDLELELIPHRILIHFSSTCNLRLLYILGSLDKDFRFFFRFHSQQKKKCKKYKTHWRLTLKNLFGPNEKIILKINSMKNKNGKIWELNAENENMWNIKCTSNILRQKWNAMTWKNLSNAFENHFQRARDCREREKERRQNYHFVHRIEIIYDCIVFCCV